jgi:hypothetical protein
MQRRRARRGRYEVLQGVSRKGAKDGTGFMQTCLPARQGRSTRRGGCEVCRNFSQRREGQNRFHAETQRPQRLEAKYKESFSQRRKDAKDRTAQKLDEFLQDGTGFTQKRGARRGRCEVLQGVSRKGAKLKNEVKFIGRFTRSWFEGLGYLLFVICIRCQ